MAAPAMSPTVLGRYAIFDRIAAGGMATVHVGRLVGHAGFARTVAIKRLHPQYALDPEFVAMFLDEARLAARIRHPNVVPTLDVITFDGEPLLVMEYVDGESLSTLLRTARLRGESVNAEIAAGVIVHVLQGLHAAHDARNDHGEPLEIVHRDVSPQNVLVGPHGIACVLDFGIAKALGKLHVTRDGRLKGKLGYLSPEQVLGHPVTRRSDLFAAGVVLWEMLAGRRLFEAPSEGAVLRRIVLDGIEPPSAFGSGAPAALEAVVMRALSKEPADRFDTALAMVEAIEAAGPVASARAVGRWMRALVDERLAARAQLVTAIESCSASSMVRPLAGVGLASHGSAVPDSDVSGAWTLSVTRRGTDTSGAAACEQRSSRIETPASPSRDRRTVPWGHRIVQGALLAIVAAGSLAARMGSRARQWLSCRAHGGAPVLAGSARSRPRHRVPT